MLICDIGQNYMGDISLAKEMIKQVKEAGGDLAKFQLFDYETLYPEHNIPKVELTFKDAKELFDYGVSIGQEVFFSVFDVERVKWAEEIGVKRYKIAYSQRNNCELIEVIPFSKPLFVSTDDVPFALSLYCVPKYPANITDYKYKVNAFDGISDHVIGLDLAKIVLARKPEAIIEKHFCVRHDLGIDAPWSMDKDELAQLKAWETTCRTVLR